MRPSNTLVVDANIVISVVLGFKTRVLWAGIINRRRLVLSAEGAIEALAVAARQERKLATARQDVSDLLTLIEIMPPERYASHIPRARVVLRNAAASRNGSVNDAHILALAWTYDADIWSHDRDFAGTGWPSWSSANLAAVLADEAEAEAQPV